MKAVGFIPIQMCRGNNNNNNNMHGAWCIVQIEQNLSK